MSTVLWWCVGIGAIFSRKGDEGIRGLYIKSLVLAEVGIVSIANEVRWRSPAERVEGVAPLNNVFFACIETACVQIALMPDERKEKAVYLDGLLYSVASIYPLSVKNSKEYRALWHQALDKQPDSDRELAPPASSDEESKRSALAAHEEASGLSPKAFRLISSSLLSHRSLSRRVKVWTMVLVHLLAPFQSDSPLAADQQPAIAECSQLQFFRRVAEMLYRSGTKLAFCIFDRTDIEDDESYDEEIEFHLLISLFELFLQFFAPFARTIRDVDASTTDVLGVAESFQRAIEPVKRLWPLLNAGLGSIDDSIATPQRFSLLLHILQVIEQLEAAFLADEEATLTKLFEVRVYF
ncbi:hypothetical protein BBJ28_00006232 [Nothophytophthora sp. Chile5]|nr:hypothetical protein BBJ28_00006232 [Nothophytophthora sp. Chile5]